MAEPLVVTASTKSGPEKRLENLYVLLVSTSIPSISEVCVWVSP